MSHFSTLTACKTVKSFYNPKLNFRVALYILTPLDGSSSASVKACTDLYRPPPSSLPPSLCGCLHNGNFNVIFHAENKRPVLLRELLAWSEVYYIEVDRGLFHTHTLKYGTDALHITDGFIINGSCCYHYYYYQYLVYSASTCVIYTSRSEQTVCRKIVFKPERLHAITPTNTLIIIVSKSSCDCVLELC